MENVEKAEIEALDVFSTDELYGALTSAELHAGDQERDLSKRASAGRIIFVKVLPLVRETVCKHHKFKHALTERPLKTPIEIAVIIADVLMDSDKIVGIPVGAVALIVVREFLERLCVAEHTDSTIAGS